MVSLNKPSGGDTDWTTEINNNWTTIEDNFVFPKNHIAGLITSNNGTDADHDIDIATGECRDAADGEDMVLSSALTKRIDAAWAVGTNQGGLDTGSVAASTDYAIWLIKRTDTGVVDALFSTSYSSPTMPTDYDTKRLIGAVVTDGSANIREYTQQDNEFWFTDAFDGLTDSTITSNVFETGTFTLPPSSTGFFGFRFANTTGSAGDNQKLHIRGVGGSWGAFAQNAVLRIDPASDAEINEMQDRGEMLLDGSSQLEYAASEISGSTTVYIYIWGFRLHQRKEA